MFKCKGKLTHGTGVLFPFHENAIVSRSNRVNFTGDVVFMMDALLLLVRRSLILSQSCTLHCQSKSLCMSTVLTLHSHSVTLH